MSDKPTCATCPYFHAWEEREQTEPGRIHGECRIRSRIQHQPHDGTYWCGEHPDFPHPPKRMSIPYVAVQELPPEDNDGPLKSAMRRASRSTDEECSDGY